MGFSGDCCCVQHYLGFMGDYLQWLIECTQTRDLWCKKHPVKDRNKKHCVCAEVYCVSPWQVCAVNTNLHGLLHWTHRQCWAQMLHHLCIYSPWWLKRMHTWSNKHTHSLSHTSQLKVCQSKWGSALKNDHSLTISNLAYQNKRQYWTLLTFTDIGV